MGLLSCSAALVHYALLLLPQPLLLLSFLFCLIDLGEVWRVPFSSQRLVNEAVVQSSSALSCFEG